MNYNATELLNVIWRHYGQECQIGRLALKNRQILFEYNSEFIKDRVGISPFKLPLRSGVFTCDDVMFEGLFGVFNDSLPDGWGRLLLDRQVERYGMNRMRLTPLDRLAHVGRYGMGALSYEPEEGGISIADEGLSLDKIAQKSRVILEGKSEEIFEELLLLNGSSAGARPKIVAGVSDDKKTLIHGAQELKTGFSHWMIKFPSSLDFNDVGVVEYIYALMAQEAGIEMPETYLFETKSKGRYFGIKRFDRDKNNPIHMHSLCGLIHADHRTPSLDYEMVLRVTMALTKNMEDVEKAFRLACFNVFFHNRDDHSKNISYILTKDNQWRLSPAYDLTFSYGPSGEQSMMVMGEGRSPKEKNLQDLARKFDLKSGQEIIEQVKNAVLNFEQHARHFDLEAKLRQDIVKHLSKINTKR